MTNSRFPTFTLETTKNYVFVAGGGGSEDYGKENGILAFRKSKVGKAEEKPKDFFKTSDIILQLRVFTESSNELCSQVEELAIKERPAIAEKLEMSDSEDDFTNQLKTKGSKASLCETEESIAEEAQESEESTRNRKESRAKTGGSEQEKAVSRDSPIFIVAVGDKKLYVLTFDGKFTVRCISSTKVKQAYLNRHLILLRNSTISGFYDFTAQSKPDLDFKIKKIHENPEGLTEEYVYKLYKKKNEIVALTEYCTEDVPEDWSRFFIFGGSIHKIITEKGKNAFVFQNRKYEIEGRISDVLVSKEKLIFFSNVDAKSQLYFLNHTCKTYDLPNLTAITQFDKTTAVATSAGDVLIYVDGFYIKKYIVSTVPISGLSLDCSKLFYCTITGDIGSIPYSTRNYLLLKLTAFIAVAFAIILAVVLRYYN